MFTKLIALIPLLFALSACGNTDGPKLSAEKAPVSQGVTASVEPQNQTDVTGLWRFTEGDFVSEVKIQNGKIQVTFGNQTGMTLYWAGFFDNASMSDGDRVTLDVDEKAMNANASISDAKTMTFTYENEKLVYDLQMMGQSKPVHLEKVK